MESTPDGVIWTVKSLVVLAVAHGPDPPVQALQIELGFIASLKVMTMLSPESAVFGLPPLLTVTDLTLGPMLFVAVVEAEFPYGSVALAVNVTVPELNPVRFRIPDQVLEPEAVTGPAVCAEPGSLAVRTTVAPASAVPETVTEESALLFTSGCDAGVMVGVAVVVFFVPVWVTLCPAFPAGSVAYAA
jgi:hypothetical protein